MFLFTFFHITVLYMSKCWNGIWNKKLWKIKWFNKQLCRVYILVNLTNVQRSQLCGECPCRSAGLLCLAKWAFSLQQEFLLVSGCVYNLARQTDSCSSLVGTDKCPTRVVLINFLCCLTVDGLVTCVPLILPLIPGYLAKVITLGPYGVCTCLITWKSEVQGSLHFATFAFWMWIRLFRLPSASHPLELACRQLPWHHMPSQNRTLVALSMFL